MTLYHQKALLPAGFHDLLAEEAAFSEAITSTLIDCFQRYGYDYVNPPLIEFETSLFSGQGKALAEQTFRLLDPHSHRMMGIRPDITMQIVRIATTRLKNEPLPIRLSYAGPVLRVKGTDLYGERQLTQAGIELIGAKDTIPANAEVIIVVLDALKRLGLNDISVDFNLPGLTSILLASSPLEGEEKQALQQALNKKDTAQVAALAGADAPLLLELLSPHEDADRLVSLLDASPLPEEARKLGANLNAVMQLVRKENPAITLTVDPLEYRGFEYHTGIGFSLFAREAAAEIGRGGRYRIDHDKEALDGADEAVGITFDINALLRILPLPAHKDHVYIPYGTPYAISEAFRTQGLVTIHGLKQEQDTIEEARKRRCNAVYQNGKLVNVT